MATAGRSADAIEDKQVTVLLSDTAGTLPPQQDNAAPTIESFKVADVVRGAIDVRGEPIASVLFKRGTYAIYTCSKVVVIDREEFTNRKVHVQYADDPATATEQIASTSDLIPLRDQLQYLVAQRKHPTCYVPQIGEAFRLALEKKTDVGKIVLQKAIEDVQGCRAGEGRMAYLGFTVPIALFAATVLIALAPWVGNSDVTMLLQAAGGGAIGALLSIIIAIRNRTVALDGDWTSNILDGAGRLLIGVISAAALYLILTSGIIAEVKAGEATLIGRQLTWQWALVIGFAAGFLERLVPDLLKDPAPK